MKAGELSQKKLQKQKYKVKTFGEIHKKLSMTDIKAGASVSDYFLTSKRIRFGECYP